MNNCKHITMDEMKYQVQEKVKKEYEDLLEGYRKLPTDKRYFEMGKDSEKLSFYKRFYVVIIIGDLYSEEWVRLFYLFDGDIIKEYYDSYRSYKKDLKKKEKFEYPFIHSYVTPRCGAYA